MAVAIVVNVSTMLVRAVWATPRIMSRWRVTHLGTCCRNRCVSPTRSTWRSRGPMSGNCFTRFISGGSPCRNTSDWWRNGS